MNQTVEVTMQPVRPGQKVSGPPGLPVLGNTLSFQKDRLGFITQTALQYGEVAKYRLGPITFYQINHPEGVQRVLQDNNHNYIKGKLMEPLRKMFGEGLFMSEGDIWRRQRRLMQPAFHRQHIAAWGELMTDAARRLAERWQTFSQKEQAFDVSVEMTHLTMEIVTQALFSTTVKDENNLIGRAITTVLRDIAFRFEVPFYPPVSVPTPRNLRYRVAMSKLDQIIYRLIRERREQKIESPDLLALLLDARYEETGKGMSDVQLRDEIMTIFIAGHETTANALSWTWYLLSSYPEAARRLRAELDGVLAGRIPTAADLPNLPYTKMVIEETMRLYPPAWITNRNAVHDDVICGYHIPAGAAVAISPYVIHHHPAVWKNPEGFDPERFSPENSAGRARFSYFPFGGGPRQCIGNGFAMVEAQLVLATLAQQFQLDLVPGLPVTREPSVTLRPQNGLWMTAHKV